MIEWFKIGAHPPHPHPKITLLIIYSLKIKILSTPVFPTLTYVIILNINIVRMYVVIEISYDININMIENKNKTKWARTCISHMLTYFSIASIVHKLRQIIMAVTDSGSRFFLLLFWDFSVNVRSWSTNVCLGACNIFFKL